MVGQLKWQYVSAMLSVWDQPVLLSNLLRRFIVLELAKKVDYNQLPEHERSLQVTGHLERLEVAALGMFNPRTLSVRASDLSRSDP